MGFDHKTSEYLQSYVYALIDPENGKPFYIGKGKGNRVFSHVACALEHSTINDKYEKIREIKSQGHEVKHVIIRHGMTDKVAFEVESSLIDFLSYLNLPLTNEVLGHNSIDSGLMTVNEVIRKYNAEPLEELLDPVIIININQTYQRGSGAEGIYRATKEAWVVGKNKIKTIEYALSEYRGLIVEVYKIDEWYCLDAIDKSGKPKLRWGFNGKVAENAVRERYINKSVAHIKKRGASNPIRYRL